MKLLFQQSETKKLDRQFATARHHVLPLLVALYHLAMTTVSFPGVAVDATCTCRRPWAVPATALSATTTARARLSDSTAFAKTVLHR